MQGSDRDGLQVRVAVITGGGGAFGKAIALAFAKRGVIPVLIDINLAAMEQVAAEVAAAGVEVMVFQADVTNYSRAREVAAEVAKRTGRIDILLNNAGITQPKGFLDLTEEDWDRTIGIHLKGGFNWSQAVLPYMIRNEWGRIISISSMVAKHGGAYPTVSKTCYAAAKAGLLGLTRGLAREAAPYVTVNAICPGVIQSGMNPGITTGEAGARTLSLIPLGRFGQPVDIAAAVLFLSSDDASYITGEVMDVNGGVYID